VTLSHRDTLTLSVYPFTSRMCHQLPHHGRLSSAHGWSRNEPNLTPQGNSQIVPCMWQWHMTTLAFATSILSNSPRSPLSPLGGHQVSGSVFETTHNLKLTYSANCTVMVGYSDADHASQLHWHSIFGYAFLVGGVVVWGSKKQPTVMSHCHVPLSCYSQQRLNTLQLHMP